MNTRADPKPEDTDTARLDWLLDFITQNGGNGIASMKWSVVDPEEIMGDRIELVFDRSVIDKAREATESKADTQPERTVKPCPAIPSLTTPGSEGASVVPSDDAPKPHGSRYMTFDEGIDLSEMEDCAAMLANQLERVRSSFLFEVPANDTEPIRYALGRIAQFTERLNPSPAPACETATPETDTLRLVGLHDTWALRYKDVIEKCESLETRLSSAIAERDEKAKEHQAQLWELRDHS